MALPHLTGVNGICSRRIPNRVKMVLFHMQQNGQQSWAIYVCINIEMSIAIAISSIDVCHETVTSPGTSNTHK